MKVTDNAHEGQHCHWAGGGPLLPMESSERGLGYSPVVGVGRLSLGHRREVWDVVVSGWSWFLSLVVYAYLYYLESWWRPAQTQKSQLVQDYLIAWCIQSDN